MSVTGSLFLFLRIVEKQTTSAILPLAYLPSVSWFYFLLNTEKAVIEQFETYPKQTYRNRCTILSGNGTLDLTIPVSKPNGNKTLTKNVKIFRDNRWQRNHWRAICSAYLNSPYFEYYRDELEVFYKNEKFSLLQLNLELISVITELIGIEKKVSLTQTFYHSPKNVLDLRISLNPKKNTKELFFPEYIQVFSSRFNFSPDLSILDVLFNLGPDTLSYLKSVEKK